MKVKRGDVVISDFGMGPIVAITKSWIIHEDEKGDEICLYRPENLVSVPAEFGIVEAPDNEMDVEVE